MILHFVVFYFTKIENTEATIGGVLSLKVFLEISQNSQESIR